MARLKKSRARRTQGASASDSKRKTLRKAVEKPIGAPGQAREEAPIGAEFAQGQVLASREPEGGGLAGTPSELDQAAPSSEGEPAGSGGTGGEGAPFISGVGVEVATGGGIDSEAEAVSSRLPSPELPEQVAFRSAPPIGGGNLASSRQPAGSGAPAAGGGGGRAEGGDDRQVGGDGTGSAQQTGTQDRGESGSQFADGGGGDSSPPAHAPAMASNGDGEETAPPVHPLAVDTGHDGGGDVSRPDRLPISDGDGGEENVSSPPSMDGSDDDRGGDTSPPDHLPGTDGDGGGGDTSPPVQYPTVASGEDTGAVVEDIVPSTSGQLTAVPPSGGEVTWSVVTPAAGVFGIFEVDIKAGVWTYTLDDVAAQSFRADQVAQEIFTVRATNRTGAYVDSRIVVTISGTNDAPLITGTAAGAVAEDGGQTAAGRLETTDVDVGDSATWSLQGGADGAYGTLALGTDGHWTYTLDNTAAQGLKVGDTAQDIFTVRVTDAAGATAEQTITVSISGTNDAPLITGTAAGAVAEDGSQTATGRLDATDVDVGDTASWSIVGDAAGSYGSLTLGADGNWTYTLNNDAVQSLQQGEIRSDNFTVRATDTSGAYTDKVVTIEITGSNDIPRITGTTTGATTEDITLTANGTLTAADIDAGDQLTWSVDGSASSTYGALAIDAVTGQWVYTLDNDSAQSLQVGETVRETFTVRATDAAGGSATQLISIDITGTNDAPKVGQSLNLMDSMKEDTSYTFSVDDLLKGAQVTDIDRDTLQVTNVALDNATTPGTLVDNHDGTWTYTPGKNVSNINSQIIFSVSDGHETVSAHASVAVQPVADPANVEITAGVIRDVINTGSAGDLGRIVVPQLTTKALTEFTLEFTVLGKSVPESTTGAGPVIVNIGSPPSDKNTLTLWDPANMKVGMSKPTGGDINIATGINLGDGDSHRITLTWDAKSNSLKVYDNGDLMLTTQPPKAFPATLYMAIAEKANTPPTTYSPAGGGYRTNEHFEGTIFNVAMADKAETAAQVKAAPLAEQLEDNLLIDVRADDGQIVDTTGKHSITAVGGLHQDTLPVDSSLATVPAGSTVHLDIAAQPTDPQDSVTALMISGFVSGTVVSDGTHSVTVGSLTEKVDVTDWSLDNLTAQLPDGVHQNMDLSVTAIVSTPPYATGEIDANGQPVMASDTAAVVEDHPIYVEGASAVQPTMATAMLRMAVAAPMASAASTNTAGSEIVLDNDQTSTAENSQNASAEDTSQPQTTTDHHTDGLATTTDGDQTDRQQDASLTPSDADQETTLSTSTDTTVVQDGAAAQSMTVEPVDSVSADATQPYHDLVAQSQTTTEATSTQSDQGTDGGPAEQSSVNEGSTDGVGGEQDAITAQSTVDAYMTLAQTQTDDQHQATDQGSSQESGVSDYAQMAAGAPTDSNQEPPPPDQVFADLTAYTNADSNAAEPSAQQDDAAAAAVPVIDQPTGTESEHHGG